MHCFDRSFHKEPKKKTVNSRDDRKWFKEETKEYKKTLSEIP
jgi:hypothetical protein